MDNTRQKPKNPLVSNLPRLSFLFAFVAAFTFLALKLPRNSSAASLENFSAGNIISNFVMSNSGSMTVAEIQAFLSSKGNCNDRDTYRADWYPSLHYHIENGHFVCLADERFAKEGANYGDLMSDEEKATSQSAAEIIFEVAQEYKINPQVLLVLLEKEQGLLSDSWPNSLQFRSATGFGCPDTDVCNSKYYGFKNQLKNAANLFRSVLDGGWTNYPLGWNYIRYNPSSDCGGSDVYIENLATSALYRYTPYQPNEGALAAGYGTAPCGAYGNRNFYLYFLDYFGDPKETVERIVEAETNFEQPIEDGVYQITSKAFPEKSIDIKGGIKEGMTSGRLQIYPKKENNPDNQTFLIQYDQENGYYSILNPATGLSLDVKGNNTADATGVQVYSPHTYCNQDWLFEEDADGYYSIISRCSSKVLDASLSTSLVNIFSPHGGDNQKWRLEKIDQLKESSSPRDEKNTRNENNTSVEPEISDDTIYQIVSKAYPEKVVDIKGGVTTETTLGALQTYEKKTSDLENQIFKIVSDGEYYNIINPLSGSAFDVKGAGTENSTPVNIYPLHSNCNQDWKLEKDEAGFYTIISRCSGKVLDLSISRNRLGIFESHGGDNQKWKLVKLDY